MTLDANKILENTALSSSHANRLMMGILPRMTRDSFLIRALQEAVDRGTLIKIEPASGEIVETDESRLLALLVADIKSLEPYEAGTGSDWGQKLFLAKQHQRVPGRDVMFPTDALALAFAYYNTLENIFQAMTALLGFLAGINDGVGTVERRDRTPFGNEMAVGIRAEQVTPEEVVRLVQARIAPFGERQIPEDAGFSRYELIELWVERSEKLREGSGIQDQRSSEEISSEIRDVLRESFLAGVADPSEGLEDLYRDAQP